MRRPIIYHDETDDTIEVSINRSYADTFIKCLLASNYMVGRHDDGEEVRVKFRRDDE